MLAGEEIFCCEISWIPCNNSSSPFLSSDGSATHILGTNALMNRMGWMCC